MDFVSHTLWGYGLFGFRGRPWTALAFGAAPDLTTFGVYAVIRHFNGERFGKPSLESIPDWLYAGYDCTHSLVIATLAVLLVYRFRKDIAFAMLAWPVHILMDIPFHGKEFFPTPFLWPLSDYVFDGVSWGTPWVWYPNVAGVLLLLAWRVRNTRGRRARDACAE